MGTANINDTTETQLALWEKQRRKQRGGFKRGLWLRWGEALTETERMTKCGLGKNGVRFHSESVV